MKNRTQYKWGTKVRSSSRRSLILGLILVCLTINSLTLAAFSQDLETIFNLSENKPNASYTNTTLTINPLGTNGTNYGDWNWAVDQPWCSGLGTYDEPYVIEDLILSGGADHGLNILNSKNYYFRIENVTATGFPDAGIYFEETCNGTIIDCISSSNDYGVFLSWNSMNNTIANSTFESNYYDGIYMIRYSNDNFILNNIIIDCSDGIDIYLYSDGNQIKNNIITGTHTRVDSGIYVHSNIQDTLIENNTMDLQVNSVYGGIYCTGSITNLTVLNNTVHTNGHSQSNGFYLSEITNLNVHNNTIDAKNNIGMFITGIDGGIFGGNSLINGGGFSITGSTEELESLTLYSENNTVNGRKFYYYVNQNDLDTADFTNAGQIYLIGCDTAHIKNNNVSQATYGIILINSHNVFIEDCNATDGRYGISLQDGSSFNTIENCTLTNNYEALVSTYGIIIEDSQNNTVINCSINQNGYGVYLTNSESNDIKNCDIIDNEGTGIYATSNNKYNMISSNIISTTGVQDYGIQLRLGSSSNQIINNSIEDHVIRGILLANGADWNLFENNTISNNNNYGVSIDGSLNSTFVNNMFDDNDVGLLLTAASNGGLFYDNKIQNHLDRGIFIDESSVNYNLFYGNIFSSNNIHAHDFGSNSWNNTEKGNYWDNVTTPDVDGNGIIDDPVIISPNGIDYLPMKYPDPSLYQDSDSDGLLDYDEVYGTLNDDYGNEPTDRFDADSDDDNINDYDEIEVHGTDPNDDDTDQDLMDDGYEISTGLDPLVDDADDDEDEDTLTNLEESNAGTNPFNNDTDNDLMDDSYEVSSGLDPLIDDAELDLDEDGMPNLWEYENGFDAGDPEDAGEDKDLDTLTNLQEYEYHTNPNIADTDGDGYQDGWEIAHETNPLDPMDPGDEVPFYQNGLFWTILGTILTFSFGIIGVKIRLNQKKKLDSIVKKNIEETLEKSTNSDLNS